MYLKNLYILSLFTLVNTIVISQVYDSGHTQNQIVIYPYNKTGNTQKKIDDLVSRGQDYMKAHDFPNSIQSFQQAIMLSGQQKSSTGIGDMLMSIADAFRELSDFPHLLEYLLKATTEYEKEGNEIKLAKTLRRTGYYYLNLPYFPNAVEYFKKSLSHFERLGKQKEISELLVDIGHAYLLMQDSVHALIYLEDALSLNKKIRNTAGLARNFWIMGDYNMKLSPNYRQAMEYFKKAKKLYEQLGDQVGVGWVLLNLSDLYKLAPDSILEAEGIRPVDKYIRSMENQKKCLQIFRELLPESEQLTPLIVISEAYEKTGKYDSSLHYFKQYTSLREKTINTEKQKDVVRLETKYQYEKKEDSLKLQEDILDEKLQKQLLLAKQQQQQLTLAKKEKDLQRLVYLKTQADLQNEQLKRGEKEKQLTISEKEKQLKDAQLKTFSQGKKLDKFKLQQQWIYSIGIFILVGLVAFYLIYRDRLREIKLKTELAKEKNIQENKEAEFQRSLADVSLTALRSQMNPHFIFNCLNSIKLYTTQNDTTAATEYLSKFSKLIRLVMENSRNDRISLRSELDALRLYIEMEVMRFKEKLAYTINVDNNVETDYIEIPPLLLQPYVENAIWHGLMHKEEGGRIDINVSMQKDESLLEINIIDDGIGRAKSAELRSKTATKHKSYGMKVTSERIALINQTYKTGANVTLHDLVHNDGQPAGTQVTIQIPV
jgi:tetratricopeptide (TPR) repeat protein